jgi:hypothetical protein
MAKKRRYQPRVFDGRIIEDAIEDTTGAARRAVCWAASA